MYGNNPFIFSNANTTPFSSMGNVLKNGGVFSKLSKINWSSLLSNAQKTLNVVNQAIPIYYQVKPVFKNIRTLGRIGKEFSKINNQTNNNSIKKNGNIKLENNQSQKKEEISNIPNPTFYL